MKDRSKCDGMFKLPCGKGSGQKDPTNETKFSFEFADNNDDSGCEPEVQSPKNDSFEMEEKYSSLIDSLVDEQPDVNENELNPELLTKHRPSYEVIQRSLLTPDSPGQCSISAKDVLDILIDRANSDPVVNDKIFEYQVGTLGQDCLHCNKLFGPNRKRSTTSRWDGKGCVRRPT